MTTQTLQKLLYAVNLLAGLGLAACVAVSSTAAFEGVYEPVSAVGTVPLARSPAHISRPAEHYSSCWKTGNPNDLPTQTVQQDIGVMRAFKERYSLYSTFFVRSNGKRMGYAAIAHDRQERVYAEKESVGEYVLAQVFPDSVILKKDGISFTLERVSDTGQTVSPASRSLQNSRSPRRKVPKRRGRENRPTENQRVTEKVGQADTQQFVVSEKDKDYITDNFAKILHDVNLQTEIAGKDGAMTGVKIGHIKPGSILHRVGNLRPGDIIRKVNGKPVNSVRQAVSIYESLTKRNVKKVDVEIERNGEVFNRSYSITNQGAG